MRNIGIDIGGAMQRENNQIVDLSPSAQHATRRDRDN
jgi:hypothetical protein